MTNLAGLPPRQKQPPLVSQKLRDFAKGKECTMMSPVCADDPEKTVHCHVRRYAGAGIAEKPDDWWGYHACYDCHMYEPEMADGDLLMAIRRTQERIIRHFGKIPP
jgi:hypothetical protein